MKEWCEPFKRENSDVEKELSELQTNVDALIFFQKKIDHHGRPFILVAQIEKLNVSLADGEKRCNKVSEDANEVCWLFKEDLKDI